MRLCGVSGILLANGTDMNKTGEASKLLKPVCVIQRGGQRVNTRTGLSRDWRHGRKGS